MWHADALGRPLPEIKLGVPPLEAVRIYHPVSPEDSVRVLDDLRRRIRQDRDDLEALRELASLLSPSSSIPDRQEAARALNRALLLAPQDPDLWIRKGLLKQVQKYWSESRKALERASELAPEWTALSDILAQVQLAEFQRSDREEYFDEAIYHNTRALQADLHNPAGLKRQVRLILMRGDTLAVVDSLLNLWEMEAPQDPWCHLVRGWRLFRQDEWEVSRECFDRGIALLPETEQGAFHTLHIVDPQEQRLSSEVGDSLRYIHDWWRWRDPTPSDLLNPRHLEHCARLVESELFFGLERKRLRGWDHAPGEMVVRYGLPEDFDFLADITRHVGDRVFLNSHYRPSALRIRFGTVEESLIAEFVDFAMNGSYVRTFNRTLDEFVFARPSVAPLPFPSEPKIQDVEVWRFGNGGPDGTLAVAVALPADSWGEDAFSRMDSIITRVALYDSLWTLRSTEAWDWEHFDTDPFGRLVSYTTLPALPESLVVGLETEFPGREAWAGSYLSLAPGNGDSTLSLSDLGFFRELTFGDGTSRYQVHDIQAMPNPGHVYRVGEPLGLSFEAYHLQLDEGGMHRAKVTVSVMRPGRKGALKYLMGEGSSNQGMVFQVHGSGPTLQQTFAVDVPSLRKGDYLVEVKVTDELAERTVGLRGRFRIDDTIKR